MPNVLVSAVPQQSAHGSNPTKRLIQAATLASALIPLGAVVADAAPIVIECVSFESDGEFVGCDGSADFTADEEGDYIWKFSDVSGELLYTFQVMGTAASDFTLDVEDRHVSTGDISETIFINFLDPSCIPLLEDEVTCVIFDVLAEGEVSWAGTYYIEIRWFADGDIGEFPNKPSDDGRNHIFRSEDGSNFNDVLATELYDPSPTGDPLDPALGGRGSTFSSFIAGRATVPEPATILLLGSGMAVALYRRRRR